MFPPETPQDETHRLETLRALGILDTPPEERFDRLTRMAKRLFQVPIALVSLVDADRQWFKSCDGLGSTETPRDVSFCGHAILGDDLLIIPDARGDVRFEDNPLVVGEPHIRFYAGCPLRAPNGHKVGTLCIIDREPRSFEREDLDALRDLASLVERELAAFQLATMDELTRITNRRGFLILAQYGLDFCLRQGVSATLAFLDLDHFKPINDTFGHAEGDRALVTFAEQMKATFRDSDVFARLGGDEFAVLLTNTPASRAEEILARFRRDLAQRHGASGATYDLAFSCGLVAFRPEVHGSIDALLHEGDAQMYRAKAAKRPS